MKALTREEQMQMTSDLLRLAAENGYAKARLRVTRGGTVDVEVERAEGAKPAGPEWRPKVGRGK